MTPATQTLTLETFLRLPNIELRCILSQQSVVPDVTVILSSRLPSENGPVEGAPD